MDTSTSTDDAWSAGVRIFSGRPDPAWRLARADGGRLVAIWESLPALGAGHDPPAPPPLGYRGCVADDAAGTRRWEAFSGVVDCGGELRDDPARGIERLVIGSAPAGLLPLNIAELAAL